MSIGERISTLRKEQKLSQGQLAKALDVTRQAVSKWENNLSAPDSLKLIQLSELLKTDVEYLTTGNHPEPAAPAPVVVNVVKKSRSGESGRKSNRKTGCEAHCSGKIPEKPHRVSAPGGHLLRSRCGGGDAVVIPSPFILFYIAVSIASLRFRTRKTVRFWGISNLSDPFLGIIHLVNPNLATSVSL